jgi:hypothetical protein
MGMVEFDEEVEKHMTYIHTIAGMEYITLVVNNVNFVLTRIEAAEVVNKLANAVLESERAEYVWTNKDISK